MATDNIDIMTPNETPQHIKDSMTYLHRRYIRPLYSTLVYPGRSPVTVMSHSGVDCIHNSKVANEHLINNKDEIDRALQQVGINLETTGVKYLWKKPDDIRGVIPKTPKNDKEQYSYHGMISPKLRDVTNDKLYHVAYETNFKGNHRVYIHDDENELDRILKDEYNLERSGPRNPLGPEWANTTGRGLITNRSNINPHRIYLSRSNLILHR